MASGFQHITGGIDAFKAALKPESRARFEAAEERVRQRVAAGLPAITPPSNAPCPTCNGAGLVYAHHWVAGEDPTPDLIPCSACGIGDRMRNQAIARRARGTLHDFAHVTFATCPPKVGQEAYWDWGQDFAANPSGWAWLHGGFYTGKTTLAKCIANAMVGRGLPVTYYVLSEMFDELRATYDAEDNISFSAKWGAITDAPYLVIDDFGDKKVKLTGWVEEKLFTLTQHRLERGLCTIVTTNLANRTLEAEFPRLAHRIFDASHCQVIPFTNPPVVGTMSQQSQGGR